MTQRTRRSHWAALALAAGLGLHADAQAQAPANPEARPAAKRTAARNPAGAAKSLAALARFASGQLGDSAYDKRVAAALAKLPNAKAIAKRIVEPYEALGPAERAQIFAGLTGLDQLTTRSFDRAAFDKWRVAHADALAARLPQSTRTVLAPDPVDPKNRTRFELLYRGMKVSKGADADGTDEPVVFTAVFSPGTSDDPFKMVTKTLPDTGTLGVANGAASGASAAEVWSSPVWPGGWNSGLVFLSAVLEDNGDLAQRKEDLGLLIALAKSEASEDNNPDRMMVLRRELEDTLDLLHLATHQTWDSRATQVRLLSSADYDQLYSQAPQASPFPHRLEMSHNPRGGEYTLYFDIPSPQVNFKTVQITVKQVEALGADRDRLENQLADFGMDVGAHGYTQAITSRTFNNNKNKNVLKVGWTIERQVQAGSNVGIELHLWERDAAPAHGCLVQSGWPYGRCNTYCAAAPVNCSANAQNHNHCPTYAGACPEGQVDYDINALPDVAVGGWGSHARRGIHAVFDLGSNTLSGDINGPAGTYTLTGTPGAGDQARIVVEISQK